MLPSRLCPPLGSARCASSAPFEGPSWPPLASQSSCSLRRGSGEAGQRGGGEEIQRKIRGMRRHRALVVGLVALQSSWTLLEGFSTARTSMPSAEMLAGITSVAKQAARDAGPLQLSKDAERSRNARQSHRSLWGPFSPR
eukprot:scaffold842_cov227-Pinguiococcus_pyrenoidosus.AAC.6